MDQIALAITSVAALSSAILSIWNFVERVKKPVDAAVDKKIKSNLEQLEIKVQESITKVSKKVDIMTDDIKRLDESQCKNFLVTFLKAVEKGEKMDDVEVSRAHEVYDHYCYDLHKNSYIHAKWDKLMSK